MTKISMNEAEELDETDGEDIIVELGEDIIDTKISRSWFRIFLEKMKYFAIPNHPVLNEHITTLEMAFQDTYFALEQSSITSYFKTLIINRTIRIFYLT